MIVGNTTKVKITARLILIAALLCITLPNLACSKKTADEILQEAIDARQRNDVIGAILKCEKLIEQYPEDPAAQQAQMLLGNCYLTNGDTIRSRESFQVIVDKVGLDNPVGQVALGQILTTYVNEKNYKGAIEIAEKMGESVKDKPILATSLRMTQVQLLFQDQRAEEAELILQDLIENTEDEQMVLRVMQESTNIYVAMGKPEKLIENYDTFLKRFPESIARGELLVGKGMTLSQIADRTEDAEEKKALYAKSSATMQEAVTLIRSEMDAEIIDVEKIKRGLRLAQLYYSITEVENAHKLLNGMLNDFPEAQEKPIIMTYMAELYYQEGQYEDAKKWYAKAAEADPETEIGQRAIEAILLVDKKIIEVNEEASTQTLSQEVINQPQTDNTTEIPASEE